MIVAKEMIEDFCRFVADVYGCEVTLQDATITARTGEVGRFMFGDTFVVIREHGVRGSSGLTVEVHCADPKKLEELGQSWSFNIQQKMAEEEGDSDV